MIIPIGVTTKKNTTPIIKGETIFPKKIPNWNQILFRGVKIFELKIPNIKNNRDKKKDLQEKNMILIILKMQ